MNNFSKAEKLTSKKLLIVILCVVALTAVLAVLAGCGKTERSISLIDLKGTLKIERGEETLDAKPDMELRSGDVLALVEGGSARLKIDDDKFLYLGSSSRVRLAAEGSADASRTTVYVEEGSVLTEVKKKLSDDSSFNVVTPNTTMAIRGTKTLTEVVKDVATGHVQTSNAVLEGQVKIKAVKVKADGTVVSVERDLGAGEGNAFKSSKEELVSQEEMQSIADTGASSNNGIKVEIVSEEEADVVFDVATFNATFLESVKNILIADAEEAAGEDGLSQEEIDAINSQVTEVMSSLDVIREESQKAIDEAQKIENGNSEEPNTSPVPEPVPEPAPSPVPTPEPEPEVAPEQDPKDVDVNLIELDIDNKTTHTHKYEQHTGKAASCTEAGWKAYWVCTECGDTNYTEIPALGHDYSDWSVTVEPYPVYDGENVTGWHVGTKAKTCSRCSDVQEAPVLVTPVLMTEIFGPVTALPIDFFSDFGENPPTDEMTLAEFDTERFWVATPYNRIDDAVVEWVDGGTLIASLKENDTVKIKITVPDELRDVYEDTVITILITGTIETFFD